MKKAGIIILFLITILALPSFRIVGKEHNPKLVGIWKGFEVDKQIEGVEKHWIVQRFQNGKYVIMFTSKQDCEIETFTEKGEWWTADGKFYEKEEGNDNIDSYSYEIKDDIVVNFKSIELMGEKRDDYIFSDYKVDLD